MLSLFAVVCGFKVLIYGRRLLILNAAAVTRYPRVHEDRIYAFGKIEIESYVFVTRREEREIGYRREVNSVAVVISPVHVFIRALETFVHGKHYVAVINAHRIA